MRLVLATKREVDMTERRLLFMMKPEQLEVFLRLQKAAEGGDGDAACRLGDMYREALGGLRYSPKETYRWYARSALTGYPNGQNNLGACYEHGLGCTQSYVKAVKWYRLAAAQGLAYASSNLGYCYFRGHGVGMDQGAALAWFERALEQGDDRAKAMVEELGGAVPSKRKVRFVDKTVSGKNFGIVGIGWVARPAGDASESGDTEEQQ
jgi:TPR repeat protein